MPQKPDPSEPQADSPEVPDASKANGKRAEPSPMAFVGAGFEFAAVTAIMAGIGWWLDRTWGTDPWLLITGLGIGVIGGMYKLWRQGRRFFD